MTEVANFFLYLRQPNISFLFLYLRPEEVCYNTFTTIMRYNNINSILLQKNKIISIQLFGSISQTIPCQFQLSLWTKSESSIRKRMKIMTRIPEHRLLK